MKLNRQRRRRLKYIIIGVVVAWMICSAISKVANVGWAKEYSWWLISCPLWGVGSIALLMFAVVYLVGRYEAKRMEREEDFFRGI